MTNDTMLIMTITTCYRGGC